VGLISKVQNQNSGDS